MRDPDILTKVARRVAQGEADGRVGDLAYTVEFGGKGYILPAIASYVAKGETQGRIMSVDWTIVFRDEKAPPTLRERAITIVLANAEDEGIVLEEFDFNYAVEQVRGLLERQG